MPRKLSRRDFIKAGAGGLALASLGLGGFIASAKETSPDKAEARIRNRPGEADADWAFVVDANKCIGCGRCVLACKVENRVPLDPLLNRTWVERYVVTRDREVHIDSPGAGVNGFPRLPGANPGEPQILKAFFVPKLCNQCENPPCVPVCPVNATYKTRDGIILIDQGRCIGCRYCIIACPYGARYFLPDAPVTPSGHARVVDKCTWCYHRITKGLNPACVEACPVGARLFGDLRDDQGIVAGLLKEKAVHVLKPALGTKPRVYYLGLGHWVQ